MIRNKRFFFNRKSEIEKIFSRIGGEMPQSVSVVGKRKIGKSSLLFHLFTKEIAQEHIDSIDEYVFVFVDLQEQTAMDVNQFFQLLQRETRTHLSPEVASRLPEFENTYDGFRQMIQNLCSMKKKIVIFLDEFDVVVANEKFEADFFSFLRSLANLFDLAYVVSSREELFDLCQTQEIRCSPFWNIFNNLWLGLFDRKSSLDLIKTLSSEEGHPLEEYADFILELAGDHPFFLQVACCIAFDFLVHHERVAEEDFQGIEKEFKNESWNYFEYLWKKLTDKEKVVLGDLSVGEKVKKVSVLQNLEKKGIIVEKDGYSFFSVPFLEFVREKYVEAEDAGSEPAERILSPELSLLEISQVCASEKRYEILTYLAGKEADMTELENLLKISRPAVKKHLSSLLDVGFIKERVVLKPRIKKMYSISEEGRDVLEKFHVTKEGGNEEFNQMAVEIGAALEKDEGKHVARISVSAKETLKIKGGDYVILEAENGKSVQCIVKTLRREKEKDMVLIDRDTMLLLGVDSGDTVIVREKR
jgi:DNA-binding MarR family transcriptional regulator/AAA+ ATPase superfamily predicted ATPase